LVNNTKIDVLDDRDSRNFGKMTNVIGHDRGRSILSRRVWVYVGEVSTVGMVVWMVLGHSNRQSEKYSIHRQICCQACEHQILQLMRGFLPMRQFLPFHLSMKVFATNLVL